MTVATSRFDALRLGESASVSRAFQATDLAEWAELAGLARAPAEVPEPLIAGLFSYLLGEHLPGHGTNYLKQTMRFARAARAGEGLTATVRIERLRADKALVDLTTRCVGEDGDLVCEGKALVLFKLDGG